VNICDEQILSASDKFKETFKDVGYEGIKIVFDAIADYEGKKENLGINVLKDKTIHGKLEGIEKQYQLLKTSLAGGNMISEQVVSLSDEVMAYQDLVDALKDICTIQANIIVHTDKGIKSIGYIETHLTLVYNALGAINSNILALQTPEPLETKVDLALLTIDENSTKDFFTEKESFFNELPNNFLVALKSELNELYKSFKNIPFVDGFCNLHPELIKAFERQEKINWGGNYNDFMHFEINEKYNKDIIK